MAASRIAESLADSGLIHVPRALLSMLDRTTSDLITLPSASLDALIDRSLADIAGFFGVDRAYLFLANKDGTVFDNTHEWCAAGVEPQRENLQGLPVELLPWWAAEMRAGRGVVLSSLDDLPPEAEAERAFLKPQGIQALLALPLSWRGRFWGLAGFDHVSRHRQWSADEVAVLSLIVNAFAQGFDRREADTKLVLASTVVRHAQEGIFVTDSAQRVLDVNPTFTEITGCSAETVIGMRQQDVLPNSNSAEIQRAMATAGLWRGEINHLRANGLSAWLRMTLSTVRDANGDCSGFVGVFSDVTLLREQAQRLSQLAYHDPLTQLPNRMLLADRMRRALVRSKRAGELLAVCLLDLDGFKPINDTHGHAAGDRVLIELARRLTGVLREDDTVARLGGDEFVLVLSGLSSQDDCERLLQRALAEVETPFDIEPEVSVRLTASIGVRTVPPAPEDADTLLRQADQALYGAKREGRARVHYFNAEDEYLAQQRHARIVDVVQAIERQEMRLHYQPIIDLRSGMTRYAEALVRWEKPDGTLLPPGDWLPLIEQTAAIAQLGNWVLDAALRACAAWQAVQPGVGVSVNVSAFELCDSGFAQRVAAALARHPGVSPNLLMLEIVESAPMTAWTAALATMRDCTALGASFALDDFGTGYSSLAYLKTLPTAVVKIDRSFVAGVADSPSERRIVQGIIELVRGYGLVAVAEGLETEAQVREILEAGCTLGQGYGIQRPVPEAALHDWLRRLPMPTAR